MTATTSRNSSFLVAQSGSKGRRRQISPVYLPRSTGWTHIVGQDPAAVKPGAEAEAFDRPPAARW